MKCFLASRPMMPGSEKLSQDNGFAKRLKASLPDQCAAVFVCADPDDHEGTDHFAQAVEAGFEAAGVRFRRFDVLDGRNQDDAQRLVSASDFVILAGGHVPTQNEFFSRIALRDLMRTFQGVVMGISAGTINSAETVYAQPELPGEATDPDYRRFLVGLGLTDVTVIPHYDAIRNDVLDGMRVMEDIAYPDSRGRAFYALVDGSYVYVEGGKAEICGEAYLISDGRLRQIARAEETVVV